MNPTCFHCSENISDGTHLAARVGAHDHPVCCVGCRAAAEWIEGLGLASYYRLRSESAQTPVAQPDYSAWDRPELQRRHVREISDDRREVVVLVEGLRCAACSWLIERALGTLPGVYEVSVNAPARRVRLLFDPASARLPELLQALAKLGYVPHPLTADAVETLRQQESRKAMKRLAVAGLGTMQAMMYGVAIYAGVFNGIDDSVRDFFRWLSLLVAAPVVIYSAGPFFVGALKEWRMRHISMDTPIAIAIGSIYFASLISTLLRQGEVYFDSVSMLVFFLLLGRYFEMRSRHRSSDVVDALARLQPPIADRRTSSGWETIGVHELLVGDVVRIAAGATLPADGILISTHCRTDESLLSGESVARVRKAGDELIGGSIALDGPIEIEIRRVGSETLLAGIVRMITRAGSTRPRLASTADTQASRFVLRVLIAMVLTVVAWLWFDPSRALSSALAVLVVSCPCAFALAAPATLTRAVAVLARRGVLVVEADALEVLARADCFVFDKTGTLTHPDIDVAAITVHRGTCNDALAIAAALEDGCTHPLAASVRSAARGLEIPCVSERENARDGVSGIIGGTRRYLGSVAFVASRANVLRRDDADDALVLADMYGEIARIPLREKVDASATRIVAALQTQNLQCELLSGDHPGRVAAAADTVGISKWIATATPADKLARIDALHAQSRVVAMIGDGVNDAPVLAGADVAIAVGHGAALAHASSGILLADSGLDGILSAREIAIQTMLTLKRNLRWAIAYNLSAIPLASLGWVPPWLAAIGMSASSLMVVGHSLSIGRKSRRRAMQPDRIILETPVAHS